MRSIDMIAQTFLTFAPMPPKKLQLLCYYAYSWHLVLEHQPLFPNHFGAGVHGPVDPDLYQTYRDYGWADIGQEPSINVAPAVMDFIKKVWNSYGALTADELEAIVQSERPWQDARAGLSRYAVSQPRISDAAIIHYYQSQLIPSSDT